MATKRKSTSTTGSARKKAKSLPSVEEFQNFYSSSLKLIYDLRDDANERVLVTPFIKLPPKKLYPDYTDIVSNPITISDIQRKVTKGKYSGTDAQEFLDDFKLLLDNAALYNEPDSWVVADASKVYEFVREQVAQFVDDVVGESSHELTNDDLLQAAEQLLNSVIEHEFPEIGVISGPFMDNINKKEYPDYFKVIKNPTSFNKVLGELDTSIIIPEDPVDENLERLYEETKLIFSNAQSYNDPNSLIHQDSLKLEELFEDKFQELRTSFIPEAKPLKFKIPAVAAIPEKPEPKKRGRKKKVVVESEPEESENDSDEDDIEDEEVLEEGAPAPEVKEEEEAPPIPTLESNVMGRTQTLGSTDEVFIKDAYIASSASTVSQILSQTQEFNNYRASQPVSRYQLIKDTLFSNATDSLSTLIEYKFPSNGYCTQSYTFSLPSDSSSYITMKFNLHDYLFGLKEEDIRNGQSFAGVASDEEFQCKLFVNDNEVENGSDSDDTSDVNRLRLSYDLKLSFGLNIVTFECKVSPSVSKLIKKSSTKPEESEEVAGRHTRHQLQQMKRSWEVEKYTFFIICNSL